MRFQPKVSLTRRGVGDRRECIFCGFKNENSGHLFMDCWWARSFWDSLGVFTCVGKVLQDPKEWLWTCLEEGNIDTATNIILGIFLIWKNRNRAAHGDQWWSVSYCLFKSMSLRSQCALRRLAGVPGNQIFDGDISRGWVVWCDGSSLSSRSKGGWAAVILYNGIVMECKAAFEPSCSSVLQAEVNGIIAGLLLARSFECTSSTICSDSIEAIWAVQGIRGRDDLLSTPVMDGSRILSENPNWKVRHVFRENNRGADFLAKKACYEEWLWDCRWALPLFPEGCWERGQLAD